MSNAKVRYIEANTPGELVAKINSDKGERFASQIIQHDGKFVAFLFFNDTGEKKFVEKKPTVRDPNAPASDKQIGLLKKLKYNGDTENLTKLEASQLIDRYFKEQEAVM